MACINGINTKTGKPCNIEKQALRLEKTAKAGPLTEIQTNIIKNPGAHVPYTPLNYDLRDDMYDDAMRERRGAASIRNWPNFKKGGSVNGMKMIKGSSLRRSRKH